MALGAELGLDEERLDRRIGFLRDRAQTHLEQDGARREMKIACAGSLLRDAAATAILVGNYVEAKELLMQAGKLWTEIGLLSGYALLSLGQTNAVWSSRREELIEINEELEEAIRPPVDRSRSERRKRRPMIAGSVGSARQLLDLYKSLRPHIDGYPQERSVKEMTRERLFEQSTAQVGSTEAPVRSYVHLLDAATNGDFGASARDTLSGMVLRRVEQLEAARADEHHWRLALAPAALIDFDLLALATASADARNTVSEVTEQFVGRSIAVRLPMIAARGLRPKVRD